VAGGSAVATWKPESGPLGLAGGSVVAGSLGAACAGWDPAGPASTGAVDGGGSALTDWVGAGGGAGGGNGGSNFAGSAGAGGGRRDN